MIEKVLTLMVAPLGFSVVRIRDLQRARIKIEELESANNKLIAQMSRGRTILEISSRKKQRKGQTGGRN